MLIYLYQNYKQVPVNKVTNYLVIEPVGSAPLVPKLVIEYELLRLPLSASSQGIRPVLRPLYTIYNAEYFTVKGSSSMPNPQAAGPSSVGCPCLLILNFRSYPPYLEAVFRFRNLRMRHPVMTRHSVNMDPKEANKSV
jgi:hypothetical protein